MSQPERIEGQIVPQKYGHKQTGRHREAFEIFYESHRDYRKTADTVGVSEQSIRAWANWWNWRGEADARDIEAEKRAAKIAITRRAQMIERHRRAGELMVARATQFFRNNDSQETPIERTADAINAMAKGIDIERSAEGLPTWIFDLLGADDDTLAAIVRQAAAEQQTDGGDSEQIVIGPGDQYDGDDERFGVGSEERDTGERQEPPAHPAA